MEERPELKSGIFGLSPQKVSGYLRQLKHLQEIERIELENKVQQARAEQVRLRQERDELLLQQQLQAEQLYLQELLLSRANDVLHVMHQHTQAEIEGLHEQLEQKQVEHQRKVTNIELQTDHYNDVLNSMLQEFGATMHKFTSSSFELLDVLDNFQPESVTETVEPEGTAEEATEEVAEEKTATEVPASASSAQPAPAVPAAEIKHENVIQFKAKHQEPQVTAPPLQAKAAGAGSTDTNFAFWGNIGSYVSGSSEESESVSISSETPDWHHDETAPAEETPHLQPEREPEVAYEPVESRESSAVSSEILSIRNRYIVGKIAGADLHDANGRLLVSKGAKITEEVASLAEKAGSLPELILNMKLPEAGTDK
ncbi:hypothetical protein JJB07_20655 [Tumebacillus sp. ITR2]|uniref:Uncharacterized protein n=1 Tax=Tumebacillus amylolyticus TaxID=2801339 RepID=A0ABS1JFE3_9BACL|nr:hypothetical protein [Tumebacillus amylolyticus]MBL0389006.1 hypothetical protein [Tumebacillus amylolyticus]